jgi:hypothetical protein
VGLSKGRTQPAARDWRPIQGRHCDGFEIRDFDHRELRADRGTGDLGLPFFAEYHATGKWAKNVTGLLAGLGLLTLAFALMITPANAEVIAQIAQTKASVVFLTISSGLLLAAITAFGIITYSKPLRLLHQRRIQRDLNRDLPKIP